MDIQQANVQRFDSIANEWEADAQHVLMGQKLGRAMRAALAPTGSERALEFGAGTGLATLLMAPKVAHLTALDSSAGMLDVLRRKCALKHVGNVEIIVGGVPDGLPAGPFDLIYSAMTLHHVEDVPALLRALWQRLAPGGRVALADLDHEDGSFHHGAAGVAHLGFERAAFGAWLTAAGFTDVAFSTAWTVRRQGNDGRERDYPIFLASARRPAA